MSTTAIEKSRSWWQWPNLLSLDAPAVALVWQELLARTAHVELQPEARTTLFLAVWAVYLADRLLDTRRPPRPVEPARHQFARLHVVSLSVLLCLVVVAGAVSAAMLRPAVLTHGVVLSGAVLLYLAAVHALRLPALPKEFLVALLFTAGTALAPWVRSNGSPSLILPSLALGVLCWLNLVGIEASESPDASGSTAWGARHLRSLAVAAAVSGWNPGVAAAAAGLIAWRSALPRLGREAGRVLADVPLLLPALFWVGS